MKFLAHNKKGVGPDFLISILLLGIVGLGGVFFLQVFVNGMAMQGLIAILDSETDQRCFYILLPLIGDDYVKSGVDTSKPQYSNFKSIQDYYGGHDYWMDVSFELNQTVTRMHSDMVNSDYGRNITYMRAYIATGKMSDTLRSETYGDMQAKGHTLTQYCSVPIYSPVGMPGQAELFISERLNQ